MSIYSGFPTRKDEGKYNQLLVKLIQQMQHHLLELLQGVMPQNKAITYSKTILKMKQYEEHKYLPPKITEILSPLAELVGLPTQHNLNNLTQQSHRQNNSQLNNNPQLNNNSHLQHPLKKRLNSFNQLHPRTSIAPLEVKLHKGSIEMGKMFQSSFELKGKKKLFEKQSKLGDASEEASLHQTGNYNVSEQGKLVSQHISKHNKKLRYRGFNPLNALQQASQNIGGRVDSRRRLKTETQSRHTPL